MKTRKDRNYHCLEGGQGNMMTKCSVGSWVEAWNRKRALVEKLIQSKQSLQFSEQYQANVNFLVLITLP
jgi:hypothetical protein